MGEVGSTLLKQEGRGERGQRCSGGVEGGGGGGNIGQGGRRIRELVHVPIGRGTWDLR